VTRDLTSSTSRKAKESIRTEEKGYTCFQDQIDRI
jgi:hypothetical protein